MTGGAGGRLFHGGYPNLRVGDLLLPPAGTGAPSALGQYRRVGSYRDDRVYVTDDPELAEGFARTGAAFADWPGGGAVYAVEPLGELEDEDEHRLTSGSWAVPSARVLAVVRTSLRMRARDWADLRARRSA